MEINNYPNYLIYNDGRVYSKSSKIFLKPSLNKINCGYLCVNLYKDGKGKNYKIHRLIGLHYIPLVEGKDLIDHIDRNKTNNNISNLRWVNKSENNINVGLRKDNKTGYKNITWDKNRNKYKFTISINGKKHSKRFSTLEQAIEYRDNY
tara:strand:+ start:49 stop:495 length:447 start_codon:yes stop_codon:yes gene_type:complete